MLYKSPRKKRVKAEDYYAPVQTFVDLIGNLLRIHEDDKELEDRKMRGEDITKVQKSLTKDHELLNRWKVDVLNRHVFQAMANITYLLEMMQQKPYIRERFDNDIKELFLTKSSYMESNLPPGYAPFMADKPIFERFVGATLKMIRTQKGEPLPDYRLVLIDIVQRLIFRIMEVIGRHHFDDRSLWEEVMKPDFQRVVAWIREVSHEARMKELADEKRRKKASEKDSENVSRPALF